MATQNHPTASGARPVSGPSIVNMAAVAGLALAADQEVSAMRKATFRLKDVKVPVVKNGTTAGFGTVKLGDLPLGMGNHLNTVMNLTTEREDTDIEADAPLVWAVGSAAAGNDATLTGTEATFAPSTAGTLVGGAGTAKNTTVVAPGAYSGRTVAVPIHLNAAGDNTSHAVFDSGVTDTHVRNMIVNGTIEVFFIPAGNNV